MISEKHKTPGVCYAESEEGFELPVIDLTHPAFEIHPGANELSVLSAASLRHMKDFQRMPRFLQRYMMRRSRLLRDASSSFLGGMTTYLQKLGPENLRGSYASGMDRRIAAAIGPVCMRLRLRDMARCLASGLVPVLAARPDAPLNLLNIGGGAAPDSLNALLLLCHTHRHLLQGRSIELYILDVDTVGPAFAARSLSALSASGAPLHDLKMSVRHIVYDWNHSAVLRKLLEEIRTADNVMAVSSEGGLFEYGSDEAILNNLRILQERAPDNCVLVGSVIRDEESADPNLILLKGMSRMTIRMLGLDAFSALVQKVGWMVTQAVDGNPYYQVVSLRKMAV